jgi:uncharacterized protein DUF6328
MPSIEARLKDLLDETRLAMLGTQLLMGLQYNAAFAPRFESLPVAFRWLDGLALLLILVTASLLLANPSYHQIAEDGHATIRMLARASTNLKYALLPLSVALGMDVAIGVGSAGSEWAAAAAGGVFVLGAVCLWYAFPLRAAASRVSEDDMEDKEQSLEARIVQALTELRVILPGAQALFGFQFAAVLTERFSQLPAVLRSFHLASFGVVAVAVVMLIAPAAYHRIAAGGNAEESVLRYTIRMMLPAEGLLALGLVGDAYVTMRLIFNSNAWATGVAIVALATFASLLYVVPLWGRSRRLGQVQSPAQRA